MRPFDIGYIWKAIILLLPFLGRTLEVMLLSVFFGTIFGALLAWGRLSRSKTARALSLCYIHIIRCTPSIVLLFIVFYGFPFIYKLFTGITLHAGMSEKLISVVTALSLLSSASMCELIRSAYLSIDSGQKEAAFCCGMSRIQTSILIIIPQAIPAAIPNFCNTIIGLLKQGALAFTIGFIDIMGQAQLLITRAYGAHGLEIYIALALLYWAITIILEKVLYTTEHHFSRGQDSLDKESEESWN